LLVNVYQIFKIALNRKFVKKSIASEMEVVLAMYLNTKNPAGIEMNKQSARLRQSDRAHPRRRATLLRYKARVRARRLGLDFDLPIEWVRNQLERGTCAVTGIPFDLAIGLGSRFHSKYAPTIDRIDPSQGYTREKCQVVVCQYNAAKGAWAHEDVMILARTLIAMRRT
jgi:hypothetical protein